MSDYFYPKLQQVSPAEPYKLLTSWDTGEKLTVDIERLLRSIPELKEILDPPIFARVHIGEWGQTVEWFDDELAADNIYALAKEQAGEISHQMFDEWVHRNRLSLSSAAEALGISRRMVSYYRTAHKPIPRQTWLACLGWEAINPNPHQLPRRLPASLRQAKIV